MMVTLSLILAKDAALLGWTAMQMTIVILSVIVLLAVILLIGIDKTIAVALGGRYAHVETVRPIQVPKPHTAIPHTMRSRVEQSTEAKPPGCLSFI